MIKQQAVAENIALDDLGFERALAAFITFRCRASDDGKSIIGLHYQDHHDRLVESCNVIGINISRFTPQYFWERVCEKIKSSTILNNNDIVVKIYVTAGESADHMTCISGNEKVYIFIAPLIQPPTRPLRLKLIDGAYDFHSAKFTGKYAWSAIYRNRAQKKRFDDILLVNDEYGITETSVGNIFFVNKFVTKLSCIVTPNHALRGVTRSIVLGLSGRLGYKTRQITHMKCEDILIYNEAFLTSTTKGIVPIYSITGNGFCHSFDVGSDTVVEKLRNEYNKYVEQYFTNRGA